MQILIEKFIQYLKENNWTSILITSEFETQQFDLLAYSPEGKLNAFEFKKSIDKKAIRQIISYKRFYEEVSKSEIFMNLVILDEVDIKLTKVSFHDLNLIQAENIIIYGFDGKEFDKVEFIVKEVIDKDKEYLELVFGEKKSKDLLDKLKASKLSTMELSELINEAYMIGCNETIKYVETFELVSILSGDLAVGGFIAGGIFLIIDALRNWIDCILLGAGFGAILFGVFLFWVLKLIKKRFHSKNIKIKKIAEHVQRNSIK